MTTTVTVKANHGWPVKVQQRHPETDGAIINETIVPAGSSQDFVCHSHADVIVHEIQPDEVTEDDEGGAPFESVTGLEQWNLDADGAAEA